MTRSRTVILGALFLALVATAGAGLVRTSASAGTTAPAVSTARERIVAVARAELANDSRNKEVNGNGNEDCNFYTGAVRTRTASCPNEGWGDDEWCADFVKYVWKTSGTVKDWEQLGGLALSVYQYGDNHNTWHEAGSAYSPQPGDAFTKTDANGNERPDHTGLVVENLGGGRFRTIEGNVPDRIDSFVRSVHDSDVWGFAAPVLDGPDDPPPTTEHHYATGSSGVRFETRFRSFFRRPDNEVVEHRYTAGGVGWTNHEIDGAVASPPQVIVHRNDLWVVARGTDGQLKYRLQKSGGAWGSWLSVPGGFSGTPALAVRDDRMHVFIRSGAQVMYRYHDAGAGWNAEGGWLSLKAPPGVTPASDPATGYLDDRMFVAVRGSDGNVWVRSFRYEKPEWSDWTKLTGQFTGALSLATHNGEVLFVFGRGSDGQVRYHSLTKGATGWAQNRTLAGNIGGSPAAISFDRRLTVYARNGAGEIIYRTETDAGWSGWLELGKPGTSLPVDSSPMAMRYGATRIMAARGTNAQLYIRSYSDANSWSNWTLLSGTHAPLP